MRKTHSATCITPERLTPIANFVAVLYLGAAITVGIKAWPDLAQKIHSCAQLSIRYGINFLAFLRLRNNGQAKDIVLAWYGCN